MLLQGEAIPTGFHSSRELTDARLIRFHSLQCGRGSVLMSLRAAYQLDRNGRRPRHCLAQQNMPAGDFIVIEEHV